MDDWDDTQKQTMLGHGNVAVNAVYEAHPDAGEPSATSRGPDAPPHPYHTMPPLTLTIINAATTFLE